MEHTLQEELKKSRNPVDIIPEAPAATLRPKKGTLGGAQSRYQDGPMSRTSPEHIPETAVPAQGPASRHPELPEVLEAMFVMAREATAKAAVLDAIAFHEAAASSAEDDGENDG